MAGLTTHRNNYLLSFIENPRSPLTAQDTSHLRFFSIDRKWAVKAKFTASKDTNAIQIPTYSGITKIYQVYGRIEFSIHKQPQVLEVYYSPQFKNHPLYKNHLFLPFKDLTNGDSTYGGGRYLDLSTHDIGKNGIVMIDFNKCYNPWCAYSDGYNCPVPPAKNHLSIAIPAGEKMYEGIHKTK